MNIDTGIEKIEEKIRHRIREYSMLPAGASVLVGFSGGADSMALLHFLWHTQGRIYCLGVGCACEPSSQRVRRASGISMLAGDFLPRERGIPLRVFRRENVEAFSLKRESFPVEEVRKRKIRYASFPGSSGLLGSRRPFRIATAHTASDLTETVLSEPCPGRRALRVCRGFRLSEGKIIRPLLSHYAGGGGGILPPL